VKILLCKISTFYGGRHELAEPLRSYLTLTDLSRKIEGDSVRRVELARHHTNICKNFAAFAGLYIP